MFLLFFNLPVAGLGWLTRARPVFALSLKLNWSHLSSVATSASNEGYPKVRNHGEGPY